MTTAIFSVIFLSIAAGCAGTGGDTSPAKVEQQEKVPPPAEIKPQPGTKEVAKEEPYDLESEMPEDDSVKEEEKVEESIKPLKADTFSVEETVEPPAEATGYDLGYRIQLAAFTDPAGARELKKKVMAAAGIAVYIDYEDSLYKVRAGDFATRADAYEARARFTADYPDCWIVRTTIMKTR
jgi:cell division septation protein DedD